MIVKTTMHVRDKSGLNESDNKERASLEMSLPIENCTSIMTGLVKSGSMASEENWKDISNENKNLAQRIKDSSSGVREICFLKRKL